MSDADARSAAAGRGCCDRTELIDKLSVGCELEQGLCLQYLFTAFTLKDSISAVEPRWGAVVTRVNVVGAGRATGVTFKDGHTREERSVSGKLIILCSHAVETAKILLMSGIDQAGLGAGVANSSGLVGRYLMDHHIKIAYGMADVPLYPLRGPLSTTGIESLRDGDFRRYRAAFRVEIEAIGSNWATNSPFGTFNEKLSAGMIGEPLRRAVGWDVNRQVQLDALLEPKPNYDSRVSLARDARGDFVCDELGVPRPRLDFVLDDFTVRGAYAFSKVADLVIKRMGGAGATMAPAGTAPDTRWAPSAWATTPRRPWPTATARAGTTRTCTSRAADCFPPCAPQTRR